MDTAKEIISLVAAILGLVTAIIGLIAVRIGLQNASKPVQPSSGPAPATPAPLTAPGGSDASRSPPAFTIITQRDSLVRRGLFWAVLGLGLLSLATCLLSGEMSAAYLFAITFTITLLLFGVLLAHMLVGPNLAKWKWFVGVSVAPLVLAIVALFAFNQPDYRDRIRGTWAVESINGELLADKGQRVRVQQATIEFHGVPLDTRSFGYRLVLLDEAVLSLDLLDRQGGEVVRKGLCRREGDMLDLVLGSSDQRPESLSDKNALRLRLIRKKAE